jgi:hypothetical protein
LLLLLQELWGLSDLEGLWVHGNMLQELPQQVGQLSKLKMLSLAGEARSCCVLLLVVMLLLLSLQLRLLCRQLYALAKCMPCSWQLLYTLSCCASLMHPPPAGNRCNPNPGDQSIER